MMIKKMMIQIGGLSEWESGFKMNQKIQNILIINLIKIACRFQKGGLIMVALFIKNECLFMQELILVLCI